MILIIPLIVLLIIFAVRINSLSNELIKLKEENDMLHRNIYNMASKLNNQAKKKRKNNQTTTRSRTSYKKRKYSRPKSNSTKTRNQ